MLKLRTSMRYSTFFLHGTDTRPLTPHQQLQISEFVGQDPNSNSFMVYNSTDAKRVIKNWYQALPWVKPYFSLKANPIPPLVSELIRSGVGMACTSRAQLKMALEYGLRHVSIIYSNPIKDEVDLKWASDNNIVLTVADSIDELKKIKELAPRMKILWRVGIKEEGRLSTSKYGDDIFTDEQISLRMKEIKQLGISLEGVHFHCNPSQHQSNVYRETVLLGQKIIRIGREYGHRMEIMNVGGAFSKERINQQSRESLEITKDDPLGYQVIAEPGRYLCSNTCYLLTRVLAKRIKSGKPCFQLNDSLYHAFNCILLDGVSFQSKKNLFYSKVVSSNNSQDYLNHPKKNDRSSVEEIEKVQEVGAIRNSTVFGMTCDGLDIISNNFFVPEELDVGDWLCFSGMGAYTYGPRTTFNGMRSVSKIIHWSSQIQDIPKE